MSRNKIVDEKKKRAQSIIASRFVKHTVTESRDYTNQSPKEITCIAARLWALTNGLSFKFSMMGNMSLSGIGNWRMSLPAKFISQRSRKIISAKLIR